MRYHNTNNEEKKKRNIVPLMYLKYVDKYREIWLELIKKICVVLSYGTLGKTVNDTINHTIYDTVKCTIFNGFIVFRTL